MYILECADGSYYTGSTRNLEKRLFEHQNGFGAKHTKKRLPVKLVYCEQYNRVEDAYRREKQVQGWSHRKKQALIEENIENLVGIQKTILSMETPRWLRQARWLSLSKPTSLHARTRQRQWKNKMRKSQSSLTTYRQA